MDEKDLFSAWNSADENEKKPLIKETHRLKEIAQKKSSDIFSKIRRNMMFECISGVIVAILFPFLFIEYPIYFWATAITMLLALIFSFALYRVYFRDLNRISLVTVQESLQLKGSILSKYIKQQKIGIVFFLIIGTTIGASFGVEQEELSAIRLFLIIAFTSPVIVLIYWFFMRYLNQFYGKHLDSIEELIKSLESDN